MSKREPRSTTADGPSDADLSFQKVLDALVDPIRRSIVVQLRDAELDLSCGSIDVPVAPSTSTHHFKVLREAGVISQYYVGTSRFNTLRYNEIDAKFPGLLKAYLEAEK